MHTIGKRIQRARLAAGYDNAASFARQCGLTKQYLKNLESGLSKAPDPTKLVKISRALNVSMEWLVTGEDTPRQVLTTNPDPGDVLDAFTHLDRDQQRELLEILQAIMKLREKQ